jgi:hypothetical protein
MHRHRCKRRWAHDYSPDRSIAATFQSLPGASDRIAGRTIAENRRLVMRRSFGFNACRRAVSFTVCGQLFTPFPADIPSL